MSTFFRFAVALAVLTSASVAMARTGQDTHAKAYAGYDPNGTESVRAFWDNMQRNGN
jgi:hypothetical protein